MRALFWIPVALLTWAQAGYGLFLAALRRAGAPRVDAARLRAPARPRVTLVIAAYKEEAVIAAKVADALALDWPRDRLQVIVAVDGGAEAGADATAARAREAGADLVLELARGGKYRAQAAAVGYATGDLLAFSDANSMWEPDALVHLAAAFADPEVGYACGQVRFVNESGTNQEGLYWRYEMWLREHESALASVTAGNGAIYAVRPEAFLPIEGHDLALPFNVVKGGPAGGLRAAGAGDREDGADRRGRVGAQAADDELRVADRPARRADRPARLLAAVRAHDRLAPAAALRLAVPARGRRAGDARAARARPHVRGGRGGAGGDAGRRRRPAAGAARGRCWSPATTC